MTAVTAARLALLLSAMAAPALAQDDFQSRILAAHNDARAEVGTPPLEWNDRLAKEAQQWADTLALKGRLRHDEQAAEGENLWMGTANHFSLEEMVGGWSEERADYRHGEFPNVAKKGRVVGHYTQMVWRTTRQVGCATAPTACAGPGPAATSRPATGSANRRTRTGGVLETPAPRRARRRLHG